MKLLFVDGNNLGIRLAFANSDLSVDSADYGNENFNPDDTIAGKNIFPTGALHGFFTALAMLRRRFPDRYMAIVWDAGHDRRTTESLSAVNIGLVPEAYKENRRKGEMPQAVEDFIKQKPVLQQMLSMTNIPQIAKPGEEADDVIASYVRKYGGEDILIVTNDKDYYQLLGPRVRILKSDEIIDEDYFVKQYGVTPQQWVEVGALMGDSGDNIFGMPGWGEKTAIKAIQEHGTAKAVIDAFLAEFGHLASRHKSLNGADLDSLLALKTGGEGKERKKYAGIMEWNEFTGVALAYEKKQVKMPKTSLMALLYHKRVPLAWNLKKMHDAIELPDLPNLDRSDEDRFEKTCMEYSLVSVAAKTRDLCARQPMEKQVKVKESACLFD